MYEHIFCCANFVNEKNNVSYLICLSLSAFVSQKHFYSCHFLAILFRHCAADVCSVAEWLGCWTRNRDVASSNPSCGTAECNLGQVVHTHCLLVGAVA